MVVERGVAQQSAAEALAWLRAGRRVAAGRLVEVEGSSPFDVGATMYVDEEGRIEGSITGGCVESAVAGEALEILAGRAGAHLVTFGVSDELAGSVGLMCGGTVHVLVHELLPADRPAFEAALEALSSGRLAALAVALDGPAAGRAICVGDEETVGTLGGPELLDHNVGREAAGLLAQGRTAIRDYGEDGSSLGDGRRVFVAAYALPPRLVVVGANDFSAALARLGDWFGYRVTVADPRPAFVRSPRFSRHAEVVEAWPDDALAAIELGPRDAVVVCSHDSKFDVPALLSAFRTDAGYIGALGSRRTAADREERLREAGAGPSDLARVHAPCGLDIGAATAEETALAIAAELVASRTGRGGVPLRESGGAIRGDRSGARSAGQVEESGYSTASPRISNDAHSAAAT